MSSDDVEIEWSATHVVEIARRDDQL